MQVKHLSIKNFRSYSESEFEFLPGINLVTGPNGTGKTNLLEAIYVAMYGVSFRVADKNLVNFENDWFRLDADFSEQKRAILYQSIPTPNKRVVVNSGAKKRFTRDKRLPVVLFEPEMLKSLSGSPARIGKLLDALMIRWLAENAAIDWRGANVV